MESTIHTYMTYAAPLVSSLLTLECTSTLYTYQV